MGKDEETEFKTTRKTKTRDQIIEVLRESPETTPV
jgi:hypothetical protein